MNIHISQFQSVLQTTNDLVGYTLFLALFCGWFINEFLLNERIADKVWGGHPVTIVLLENICFLYYILILSVETADMPDA